MVRALGAETPTSWNIGASTCADRIVDFIQKTGLDGVDIAYEDVNAFTNPVLKGEQWVIDLTKRIREKLPSTIITHSPKASYFVGIIHYPNHGYQTVHHEVGS